MEQKKKKPYVKPELFYEPMQLTTHISSCDITSTNANDFGVCGYVDSLGQVVFNDTYVSACRKSVGWSGTYNDPGDNPDKGSFCYHIAGGGMRVFSS